MRDASLAIMREIGVETGGSNVQFAVNPADGRLVVIEMNPRVSRSLGARVARPPASRSPRSRRSSPSATRSTRSPTTSRKVTPACFEPSHRLHRGQGAALGVREVPGHRHDAHHAHEVGRRGHGDRPHVPRGARQGDALARERARAGWAPTARTPSTSSTSTSCLAVPNEQRLFYIAEALRRGRERRGDRTSSRASTRGSSTRWRAWSRSRVARQVARSTTLDRRGACGRPSSTASPTSRSRT